MKLRYWIHINDYWLNKILWYSLFLFCKQKLLIVFLSFRILFVLFPVKLCTVSYPLWQMCFYLFHRISFPLIVLSTNRSIIIINNNEIINSLTHSIHFLIQTFPLHWRSQLSPFFIIKLHFLLFLLKLSSFRRFYFNINKQFNWNEATAFMEVIFISVY